MGNPSTDSSVKTVLVTGGNGCLGRFLVDLIVQMLPDVTTIKVLDKNPAGKEFFATHFNEKLNVSNGILPQFEYLAEDLRDPAAVRRAVRGVDCVFHTAGVVDVSIFPDENLMWTVNCRSTQDLVEACFEESVPYLIYTSSVNAIVGTAGLPTAFPTEADTPKPDVWFWDGYGETKWYAERLVLDADKIPLPNGRLLRTVAVRPTAFYGEYDVINVGRCLDTARRFFGVLWTFGGREGACLQQTYVGNVAAAHVDALNALRERPDHSGGEAFFITDDTPISDLFSFVEPFLKDAGCRLSPFRLPYGFVYFVFLLLLFFVGFLRKCLPEWKVPDVVSGLSVGHIRFLNERVTFSRKKAEERTGYRPMFSWEESLRRSRKYYKEYVRNSVTRSQ